VHYGLRCGAREGGCGRGVAHDVVPYYYTLLYYPPLLSFSLLVVGRLLHPVIFLFTSHSSKLGNTRCGAWVEVLQLISIIP
jgi:hypothetical protein